MIAALASTAQRSRQPGTGCGEDHRESGLVLGGRRLRSKKPAVATIRWRWVANAFSAGLLRPLLSLYMASAGSLATHADRAQPGEVSALSVSALISAATAGWRRSLSRQRLRIGPMLPTEMRSRALISA